MNHYCPNCNNEIRLGNKYCQNCGENIAQHFMANPICLVYQNTNPTQTKFCPKDGTRLVTETEVMYCCLICNKEKFDSSKVCMKDEGQIIAKLNTTIPLPEQNIINNYKNIQHKASLGNRFLTAVLNG